MMTAQPELLRLSAANLPLSPPPSFSRRRKYPSRPTNHSFLCSSHKAWMIAQLSEEVAITAAQPPEVGLTELPASISSFIAVSDDPTLQTSAAILLTGAFTLFLFRSLRRRAKLAKQMRFRSTGANKSLKNEALQSLKNTSNSPIKRKSPPSADQALVGALIAAAFGLLLYKFTTTIENTLNHQVLSNNYSVRQITITIR
ncbi:hypothetical protein ACS0TY_017108 [Phlomoides rotata]